MHDGSSSGRNKAKVRSTRGGEGRLGLRHVQRPSPVASFSCPSCSPHRQICQSPSWAWAECFSTDDLSTLARGSAAVAAEASDAASASSASPATVATPAHAAASLVQALDVLLSRFLAARAECLPVSDRTLGGATAADPLPPLDRLAKPYALVQAWAEPPPGSDGPAAAAAPTPQHPLRVALPARTTEVPPPASFRELQPGSGVAADEAPTATPAAAASPAAVPVPPEGFAPVYAPSIPPAAVWPTAATLGSLGALIEQAAAAAAPAPLSAALLPALRLAAANLEHVDAAEATVQALIASAGAAGARPPAASDATEQPTPAVDEAAALHCSLTAQLRPALLRLAAAPAGVSPEASALSRAILARFVDALVPLPADLLAWLAALLQASRAAPAAAAAAEAGESAHWTAAAAAALGPAVAALLFDATAARLSADPRAVASLVPDAFKAGRWTGIDGALDVASEGAPPAVAGLPLPPSAAARAVKASDSARASFLAWVRRAQAAQVARLAEAAAAPPPPAPPGDGSAPSTPAVGTAAAASDSKDDASVALSRCFDNDSEGEGGEGDEEEEPEDDGADAEELAAASYYMEGDKDAGGAPARPWLRRGLRTDQAAPRADTWVLLTTGLTAEDSGNPTTVSLAETCCGEGGERRGGRKRGGRL